MSELIKQIFEAANHRLRSPFIGYFLITFCSLNYAELMVLFWGNSDLETRVAVFQGQEINLRVPVLVALIGPLVNTYFQWGYGFLTSWGRQELKALEVESEGATERARLVQQKINASMRREIAFEDATAELLARQGAEDRERRLNLEVDEEERTTDSQEEENVPMHASAGAENQNYTGQATSGYTRETWQRKNLSDVLQKYSDVNLLEHMRDLPTAWSGQSVSLIDTTDKDGASLILSLISTEPSNLRLGLRRGTVDRLAEGFEKLGVWEQVGRNTFLVSNRLEKLQKDASRLMSS